MRVWRIIGGAVLGGVTGVVSAVVSAGPVDMQWVGIVLSVALVAAGTALIEEIAESSGALAFGFGLTVALVWAFGFSPADDQLVWNGNWSAGVWPMLALATWALSLYWVRKKRDTSRVRKNDEGALDPKRIGEAHEETE